NARRRRASLSGGDPAGPPGRGTWAAGHSDDLLHEGGPVRVGDAGRGGHRRNVREFAGTDQVRIGSRLRTGGDPQLSAHLRRDEAHRGGGGVDDRDGRRQYGIDGGAGAAARAGRDAVDRVHARRGVVVPDGGRDVDG